MISFGRFGQCVSALALSASTWSCVTDEIVVVTLDAGPPVDHHGVACATNADCKPDVEVCDKPRCDASGGLCKRRSSVCESEPHFVCGCDGVTYWNDCLRRQAGVVSATAGECQEDVATCSSPAADECPKLGASCARLVQPDAKCSDTVLGACWILPPTCPADSFGPPWISCAAPGTCESVCAAIRSGEIHRRALSAGCPPSMMPPL